MLILCLYAQVQEVSVDYTECEASNETIRTNYTTCAKYLEANPGQRDCKCLVTVELKDDFIVSCMTAGQLTHINGLM